MLLFASAIVPAPVLVNPAETPFPSTSLAEIFKSASVVPVTSATAKVVVPARLNRILFSEFTELLAVIDEALVPPTVTVPRS